MSPDTLLVVERFGQDAVELPPTDSDKKPRLIQYKYSTTGKSVDESRLCEVLFAFVRSAKSTSIPVNGFEYELITNRERSAIAKAWFEDNGRDKAKVRLAKWAGSFVDTEEKSREEKAKTSKAKKVYTPTEPSVLEAQKAELCSDMLVVFDAFAYRTKTMSEFEQSLTDIARQYGMLEEEFDSGVDGVVSHLFQISGKSSSRIVLPRELKSKLTGNEDAVKLLSEESCRKQQADLERFNDTEVILPVIPRLYDHDLFKSVLTYPLTIVHGDGGCGKSVALSDLVATCIQDRRSSPGFCLLERAIRFTQEAVIRRVAGWRNFNSTGAGESFDTSLRRLEGVYLDRPVLLVCIDAIDEKDSQMLPPDCADFLVELVKKAVRSRNEGTAGTPIVSVILSCRKKGAVSYTHLTLPTILLV